jgi:hypothetical protein
MRNSEDGDLVLSFRVSLYNIVPTHNTCYIGAPLAALKVCSCFKAAELNLFFSSIPSKFTHTPQRGFHAVANASIESFVD